MANIFFKTGGNFSALTPQKVVAAQVSPAGVGTLLYNQYDACNTIRYQAFTPSENGTCEGVLVALNVRTALPTSTVTVTLQWYNGAAWANVAGATKTLTEQDIAGAHGGAITGGAYGGCAMNWPYFQFTTPAAIDTTPGVWRFSIVSSLSTTRILRDAAGGWSFAVVLTAATTYSAGDNIWLNGGQSFVVDQSITATNLVSGTDAEIVWANPPAASYTLTITNWWVSKDAAFTYGTVVLPIAAAVRGTLAVTTYKFPHNLEGQTDNEFSVYGHRPTNVRSMLAADANGSQAVIVTTEDMTGKWSPGDTLWIYGGQAAGAGVVESKVISTVVGTTVTLTTNLAAKHSAGWCVVDYTYFVSQAGFVLGAGGLYVHDVQGLGATPVVFKLSGVFTQGNITVAYETSYSIGVGVSRMQPYLIEDCLQVDGLYSGQIRIANFYASVTETCLTGSVFQNIYQRNVGGSNGDSFTCDLRSGVTYQHIYIGGRTSPLVVSGVNLTLSDIQVASMLNQYALSTPFCCAYLALYNCTVTDMKLSCNGLGLWWSGASTSFVRLAVDKTTYAVYLAGTCVGTTFTDCSFGQKVANTASMLVSASVINATFVNCLFDAVPVSGDSAAVAVLGSYVRSATYNQVANDHRGWWSYGKTQSSGAGLTDTTCHTAGGLAIRFEPQSSTVNHTWAFTVPTGNIAAKTMYLSVWVKIAAAAFWAGTHEKPRLTVNYDNGTLAYAEAVASTAWQLLTVPFTPATTYGEITVTLSCRTDAAGTDRYVYWDDFAVAFPPNVSLDLGAMDVWANALPVTPPLAIPLSAQTVAGAVWDALRAGHLIAGSYGAVGEWAGSIDAATIRAALGMAAANLDTQLADLPTNSELATALAGADDAVLNAIAALDDLSAVQVQAAAAAALTAYDAATGADVSGIDLSGSLTAYGAAKTTDVTTAENAILLAVGAISSITADDVLDEPVEGTLTLRQIMRVLLAFAAGKSSGGGTTLVKFRDQADTKDRIALTVNAQGTRTASTVDVT